MSDLFLLHRLLEKGPNQRYARSTAGNMLKDSHGKHAFKRTGEGPTLSGKRTGILQVCCHRGRASMVRTQQRNVGHRPKGSDATHSGLRRGFARLADRLTYYARRITECHKSASCSMLIFRNLSSPRLVLLSQVLIRAEGGPMVLVPYGRGGIGVWLRGCWR